VDYSESVLNHISPVITSTLYTVHPAFEDGTDTGFRNVGQPQFDAGEIPRRKCTISGHTYTIIFLKCCDKESSVRSLGMNFVSYVYSVNKNVVYYFRLALVLRLQGVLSTNMEHAGNSSMNCTSRRKKLYNVR